jgi:hypothetical protein
MVEYLGFGLRVSGLGFMMYWGDVHPSSGVLKINFYGLGCSRLTFIH